MTTDETIVTWTDLPCGCAYKWDGDEGRLSDCAAGRVDKGVVLSEIEAHSSLKLDYCEWEWEWTGEYSEEDLTVALTKAQEDLDKELAALKEGAAHEDNQ